MKILLIKPYITINYDDFDTYGFFPPLGLAYIASTLEEGGFEVKIIDCQLGGEQVKKNDRQDCVRIGMSDEEIIKEVKKFSPQVIGISNNFTSFAADSLKVAKLIKNICPDSILVMGGAHATIAYQDILQSGYVDVVVRGEGEMVFLELVEKIKNKEHYNNLRSIAMFGDNREIISNPSGDYVINLEGLPFPAYHLLDMQQYVNQRNRNFAFYMDYPVGFIMSSRGCPYNCIFCSTSKFFKKYRERSAKGVVDEIEFLIKNYKIKEIHFFDDSFNANEKRVEMICNEIINRKLKISWQVSQGMNAMNIDSNLLRLMSRSGLYRTGFSIESGSNDTLRYIRKRIDLEEAVQIIRDCNGLGIYTHGNFVIGFPYEKREDINATIDYIMKSNLDFINLTICQPLAGSDLYNSYQEAGLLNNGIKNGSHYLHTLYDTKYFKADELNKLRKETVHKFLIRKITYALTPRGFSLTILPKVSSIKKVLYFIKVIYNILKMIILGKNIP